MNRRDFLDSGSLARTAGPILTPFLDAPAPAAVRHASLLRFSRRAMATVFELLIPFGESAATETAANVFDLIDALEDQMTVYRDDSEMAAINRRAAIEDVAVEPGLFALLTLADRITAETWGAFDITAGPIIKAWGFFRRQGRVPTPAQRQQALECVGMRHVELHADRSTIRFRRPGVEINLGSIGKGYALDRCAAQLREAGTVAALLHGGASSVYAIGSQPGMDSGWQVGLRHPWDESRRLAMVFLRDRAMGTSAATYQHFEYKKRRLGHLLDPRTGQPAEGIASATALAPTAALADALATAFYVLGVDRTRLYCRTHPGIGAILVPEGAAPIVLGLARHEVALFPDPTAPLGRIEP
jgi:thiamine biosynthesis lipoprotein